LQRLSASLLPQEQLVAALRKIWATKHSNLERLESFHRNVMVDGRYLALPIEGYELLSDFGSKNDAWVKSALDLSEAVLCTLFEKTRLQPAEISQIAFNTVTGIAVQSMFARLMNRIPFSNSLKRVPLFGLGCVESGGHRPFS
jgi:alkylresorcinol/alkylpyrone synthase